MIKFITPLILALALFSTPVLAHQNLYSPYEHPLHPFEKWLGKVAAVAGTSECSWFEEARELTNILKKSPHFRDGFRSMQGYERYRCDNVREALTDFQEGKSTWKKYIDETYPE